MHTNGTKTIPYDGSQFLADPVDQADALNDALDSGSAAVVAIALRDIAKARGMTEVAKKVGITRAGLYKALSGDGDPKLSTFVALLAALNIKLKAEPAKETPKRSAGAPTTKVGRQRVTRSSVADGKPRKTSIGKRGVSIKASDKKAA